MNNSIDDNNKKNLQEIKTKLLNKENSIFISQIRQTNLEKEKKKLELKKMSLIYKKKKLLSEIIYNITMTLLLVLLISLIINNFNISILHKNPVFIAIIFLSVASISTLGAICYNKMLSKWNHNLRKKTIEKITKRLEEIRAEIELEIEKQEDLKHKITDIINEEDIITTNQSIKEQESTKYKYQESRIINTELKEKNIKFFKIRVKKP